MRRNRSNTRYCELREAVKTYLGIWNIFKKFCNYRCRLRLPAWQSQVYTKCRKIFDENTLGVQILLLLKLVCQGFSMCAAVY